MKIINEQFMPEVRNFVPLVNKDFERIIFVYEEDVDSAGYCDYERKELIVNIAPNVLAEVAVRYDIRPSDIPRVAMAVFLEEAIHSHGERDEAKAALLAGVFAKALPRKLLARRGVIRYINDMLEVIRNELRQEPSLNWTV